MSAGVRTTSDTLAFKDTNDDGIELKLVDGNLEVLTRTGGVVAGTPIAIFGQEGFSADNATMTGQTKTATLTAASLGWYRIAVNGTPGVGTTGDRAVARFLVYDAMSGAQGIFHFEAAFSYSENPTLTLLNSSHYSRSYGIMGIRLVSKSGESSAHGAALEVYVVAHPTLGSPVVAQMYENVLESGWTMTDWTAGSVPSGWTTTAIDLSVADTIQAVATNGSQRYIMTRSGDIGIGLGAQAPSESLDVGNNVRVRGARIYQDNGAGDQFEIGPSAGSGDSTLWGFYAPASRGIVMYAGASEQMRLLATGGVAIAQGLGVGGAVYTADNIYVGYTGVGSTSGGVAVTKTGAYGYPAVQGLTSSGANEILLLNPAGSDVRTGWQSGVNSGIKFSGTTIQAIDINGLTTELNLNTTGGDVVTGTTRFTKSAGSYSQVGTYGSDGVNNPRLVISGITRSGSEGLIELNSTGGAVGEIRLMTSNTERFTVDKDGNLKVGTLRNDSRYMRMGGGNSYGYLFGSFLGVTDGINISYNHYYDAAGAIQYTNTTAGSNNAAIQVGYGEVKFKTGLHNTPPTTRLTINANGDATFTGKVYFNTTYVSQGNELNATTSDGLYINYNVDYPFYINAGAGNTKGVAIGSDSVSTGYRLDVNGEVLSRKGYASTRTDGGSAVFVLHTENDDIMSTMLTARRINELVGPATERSYNQWTWYHCSDVYGLNSLQLWRYAGTVDSNGAVLTTTTSEAALELTTDRLMKLYGPMYSSRSDGTPGFASQHYTGDGQDSIPWYSFKQHTAGDSIWGWYHTSSTGSTTTLILKGYTDAEPTGATVMTLDFATRGLTVTGPIIGSRLNPNQTLAPTAGWSSVSSSNSKILFYDNTGTNWSGMGVDNGGHFWLRTGTADQNILMWDSGGHFGVGTYAPDVNYRMTVNGATKILGNTLVDGIVTLTDKIQLYSNEINALTATGLFINYNVDRPMSINGGAGNTKGLVVGDSTVTSGYRFDVNGTSLFRNTIVMNNWLESRVGTLGGGQTHFMMESTAGAYRIGMGLQGADTGVDLEGSELAFWSYKNDGSFNADILRIRRTDSRLTSYGMNHLTGNETQNVEASMDGAIDESWNSATSAAISLWATQGIAAVGRVYSSLGFWSGTGAVLGTSAANSVTSGLTFDNYGVVSSRDVWNMYVPNTGSGADPAFRGNLCFSYAFNSTGVSIKAYIENDVDVANLDFTGQHRCIPETPADFTAIKVGYIVRSTGSIATPDTVAGVTTIKTGKEGVTINESLPKIAYTNAWKQKSVLGVVSDQEDENQTNRTYKIGVFSTVVPKAGASDNRVIVNSIGEGAMWVCNWTNAAEDPNLENGDYICACPIAGLGVKQDDDLLHNYTVAKITIDCNFSLGSTEYECEEFVWEVADGGNGQTYRRAFVPVTYHCG